MTTNTTCVTGPHVDDLAGKLRQACEGGVERTITIRDRDKLNEMLGDALYDVEARVRAFADHIDFIQKADPDWLSNFMEVEELESLRTGMRKLADAYQGMDVATGAFSVALRRSEQRGGMYEGTSPLEPNILGDQPSDDVGTDVPWV